MDLHAPCALLAGLTPAQFMRRHWHKKPLLVRQALPGFTPPLSRSELFGLASREEVESRCVIAREGSWRLRSGPLARRSLPPLRQSGWTLLVQGVDLHVSAAHALLSRFRFIPDARMDDLMVSWASDGGGVGPHVDAYDVFLVQALGRRRWRIGPTRDRRFIPGLPLRILANFEPLQEWVLEPGDLLYLPPGWGHEGTALGECMTCSVGFRSPSRAELADELLARLQAQVLGRAGEPRYRDPAQEATSQPARIPAALGEFARSAVERLLDQPAVIERALGEALTEPKPRVWFEAGGALRSAQGVRLDERTRMMYDEQHLYLNGESFKVAGRDALLMRQLADLRTLSCGHLKGLSTQARGQLNQWMRAGWMHPT